MLNFERMPQDNPFALVEPGVYLATIAEADMKAAKDTTKPDYLNLKLALKDHTGKSVGNVYDIMSESDSSVVQYKIARFVRACGIPLVGSMTLSDLGKIVKGKTIAVDIAHDTKGDKPRAVVDLFSRQAYYTSGEFQEIYNLVNPPKGELNDFNTGEDAGEEIPFDGASTSTPGAAQY